MTACLCGSNSESKEYFHGPHQHITLPQRLYLFANIHKQSICICTIALIAAIFLILRKRK